jgi:alkylation response protein AidB-like acyl-CoA dehydrogenase
MQRQVFGKKLIEQPVIRFKLAQMTAAVESCQALLDSLTFQMDKMDPHEQVSLLAGPIALAKYQSTRMLLLISDNAAQIFGGRAITRTGMGKFIEDLNRAVKYSAILGGSEEIMADLGVRQSVMLAEQAIKQDEKKAMQAKL